MEELEDMEKIQKLFSFNTEAVVLSWEPSTPETAESRGLLWVWSQCGLHWEFHASLGHKVRRKKKIKEPDFHSIIH